jgi:hypothetical protein
VVALVYIPTNSVRGFLFPRILANTCWWWCQPATLETVKTKDTYASLAPDVGHIGEKASLELFLSPTQENFLRCQLGCNRKNNMAWISKKLKGMDKWQQEE